MDVKVEVADEDAAKSNGFPCLMETEDGMIHLVRPAIKEGYYFTIVKADEKDKHLIGKSYRLDELLENAVRLPSNVKVTLSN